MKEDNHEAILAAAWSDPGNTAIELPPLDVNRVLREDYENAGELSLTRTRLWDMEVRKAARPDLFITKVIRAGTARSWGRHELLNGDEAFIRVSEQRQWLDPETYGTVIEACYLSHRAQKVTFIGLAEVEDDAGHTITASPGQPLFHVEHGVSGTEEAPLNTWRIVHLVDDPHSALAQRFAQMAGAKGLPEYVERYIEDVLRQKLVPAGEIH